MHYIIYIGFWLGPQKINQKCVTILHWRNWNWDCTGYEKHAL